MPLPTSRCRQRGVLYHPGSGNVVVLGTVGSGKTTMAILRAAYLAKAFTDPGRRVTLGSTWCSLLMGCHRSAGKEAGNAPRP